jgi:hypothetical protein
MLTGRPDRWVGEPAVAREAPLGHRAGVSRPGPRPSPAPPAAARCEHASPPREGRRSPCGPRRRSASGDGQVRRCRPRGHRSSEVPRPVLRPHRPRGRDRRAGPVPRDHPSGTWNRVDSGGPARQSGPASPTRSTPRPSRDHRAAAAADLALPPGPRPCDTWGSHPGDRLVHHKAIHTPDRGTAWDRTQALRGAFDDLQHAQGHRPTGPTSARAGRAAPGGPGRCRRARRRTRDRSG